jgi:hypothetical protein
VVLLRYVEDAPRASPATDATFSVPPATYSRGAMETDDLVVSRVLAGDKPAFGSLDD